MSVEAETRGRGASIAKLDLGDETGVFEKIDIF